MQRLFVLALAMVAFMAACSDDDDSATGADAPPEAQDQSSPGSDDGAATGGGGHPIGIATVDGAQYTLVADLQCLVAIDAANQISISGTVEGNASDDLVEWAYSWDGDDGINEFSINIDEETEFSTFGDVQFSEPQVNGQSVSASGMVQPMIGEPVEASFEIDCAA